MLGNVINGLSALCGEEDTGSCKQIGSNAMGVCGIVVFSPYSLRFDEWWVRCGAVYAACFAGLLDGRPRA